MESLDRTDVKILNLLQQNSRLTNKELAYELGLTVTPVYERVKRLEKHGYIKQYVALLDTNKLGQGLIVMAQISLKEHAKHQLKKFEEKIRPLPQVMECYYVAGGSDYILKIAVPNMDAYQKFLVDELATIEHIGHVQSFFVMTEIKHTTAVPLQ